MEITRITRRQRLSISAHLAVLNGFGEQESKGGQADLLLAPGEGLVKDGGLRPENGRNKVAGVSVHTLSYCHNKHSFRVFCNKILE